MSERPRPPLHIALVAEGPTDYEIIQAALQAALPRAFVMTLVQPEPTRPAAGTGWGGVLKWCHASRQRHAGPLDSDPTLTGFDLFILHLDTDVAGKSYADCGPEIEAAATVWQWEALPCAEPCPPVAATCARLEAVLNSWLGQAAPGRRTVYCLPAQSSGTWLAVAALPATHALLAGGECNTGLESGLAQIAKDQRIKKTVREYRQQAPRITAQWSVVRQVCSQAQTFEEAVLAAVAP